MTRKRFTKSLVFLLLFIFIFVMIDWFYWDVGPVTTSQTRQINSVYSVEITEQSISQSKLSRYLEDRIPILSGGSGIIYRFYITDHTHNHTRLVTSITARQSERLKHLARIEVNDICVVNSEVLISYTPFWNHTQVLSKHAF